MIAFYSSNTLPIKLSTQAVLRSFHFITFGGVTDCFYVSSNCDITKLNLSAKALIHFWRSLSSSFILKYFPATSIGERMQCASHLRSKKNTRCNQCEFREAICRIKLMSSLSCRGQIHLTSWTWVASSGQNRKTEIYMMNIIDI